MAFYKNWREAKYRFSHNNRRDFSYNEISDFFYVDGSKVIFCKENFGDCEAGKYYLVYDGKDYGGWGTSSGFIVRDWYGFDSWHGKRYMKNKS